MSRSIKVFLPEPQTREDLARLRLQLEPVEEGKLILGFGIFRGVKRPGRFMLPHDPLHFTHLRSNRGGDLEHGILPGVASFLREITHVSIVIAIHRAGAGLLITQNDMEEGGLARPVRTHQGNTLTPVDGQVGLLEEGPTPIGHG